MTEGRPWHDSDVVLLVALAVWVRALSCWNVMLVMAKIGHNVTSKDLIDIPQSRDAITSTWANISKITGPPLGLIPMAP